MNPASRFSVADYECLLADVVHVIDEARRATARAANADMTTTYWLIGRRIVEQEQLGSARVAYGGISQTASARLAVASAGESLVRFPLPWSHYVRLIAVRYAHAGASKRFALAEAPK
jgi:hypothetical protein